MKKKAGKIASKIRRYYKTPGKKKFANKVARPPAPENPVICKKKHEEEYNLENEE